MKIHVLALCGMMFVCHRRNFHLGCRSIESFDGNGQAANAAVAPSAPTLSLVPDVAAIGAINSSSSGLALSDLHSQGAALVESASPSAPPGPPVHGHEPMLLPG